jgi:MFS superfamily sulfate permease-like transporter
VFRFDARLFYANVNRFADNLQTLMAAAPTKVRWLVLDCSSMSDVDYSASLTLAGLIDAVHAKDCVFALAAADPQLLATLTKYGTLSDFDNAHIFASVQEAVAAFRADSVGDPRMPEQH